MEEFNIADAILKVVEFLTIEAKERDLKIEQKCGVSQAMIKTDKSRLQ